LHIRTAVTFFVPRAPPPLATTRTEKASATPDELMELLSKESDSAWTKTPPPLTNTLMAWETPLVKQCVTLVAVIATSRARTTATPPPTLYVSDADAAQLVRVEECEISLDEKATSVPRTEAYSAPPAALVAPGLHNNDDDDERLRLKLQCDKFKRDSCAVSVTWSEASLGYAYDSNNKETAPPKADASSAKPDELELHLQ